MMVRMHSHTHGTRRAVIVLVTLLVALSVLTGCSTMRQARATQLDNATSNYRKLIRWGYLDEATKYLRSRDGKQPPIDLPAALKRVARYRVTSYTVANQYFADDGKDARVIALIEYYELDSGVIRSLHDVQKWWYDDKEKHWFLDSPLPAFGADDNSPSANGPLAR